MDRLLLLLLLSGGMTGVSGSPKALKGNGGMYMMDLRFFGRLSLDCGGCSGGCWFVGCDCCRGGSLGPVDWEEGGPSNTLKGNNCRGNSFFLSLLGVPSLFTSVITV